MKKLYAIALFLGFGSQLANAQAFEVDTIQYSGTSEKMINLVILGDGFTESQQDLFISKANDFSNSLFSKIPWSNYKNYFNVFAVKVISAESGVKHPNTASDCSGANPAVPVSNPNNYFGSSFDSGGIHRLVTIQSTSRVMQVLATNIPNYDHAIVLANTSYYGGSGGTIAVSTTHPDGYEITAHELGHSFGNLGDEYYAGDIYFFERPNMTQQNDPSLIKWKNWLAPDDSNIDIVNYCCGGATSQWYRPTSNKCKMEVLGKPYCSVCKESLIEKIHTLVNPVSVYTPTTLNISSSDALLDFSLSELIKPIPNTLHIKWQLDATVFDNNSETFQVDQNTLSIGTHTLTAIVTDNTNQVRTTAHSEVHYSSVIWTINKTALGIQAVANDIQLSYSLYPNPTPNRFTIALEISKPGKISVDIVSLDGKIVKQIPPATISAGKHEEHFNIENLPNGSYLVAVNIDGLVYTKTLVKQN